MHVRDRRLVRLTARCLLAARKEAFWLRLGPFRPLWSEHLSDAILGSRIASSTRRPSHALHGRLKSEANNTSPVIRARQKEDEADGATSKGIDNKSLRIPRER